MASRKSKNTTTSKSDSQNGLDHRFIDHSLGFFLAQASVAARKLYGDRLQDALDLRPVDLSLLLLLLGNQDASPKDLGKALAVSAPNLTPILDRLVARKVVRRVPSALDGRAQCIQLTAKGKKLAEKAYAASCEIEREWLEHLTQKQLDSLHSLLRKLPKD